MSSITEFCYVCMTKQSGVQRVKSTDITYVEIIHKLHSCRFIVQWSKFNENYIDICENCSVNLQISYDFIGMCSKNSNRLQAYVTSTIENEIDGNEDKTCELNVPLVDINDSNIDTEEDSTKLTKNDSSNDDLGFSSEEIRNASLYSREMCNKLMEHTETLEKSVKDSSSNTDKPFQCSICKKRYSRAFTLKRHTALHNEGKYKCRVCVKQFNCKLYLDRHILTHSESGKRKYYKCTLCLKRFTAKPSLEVHYLIHNGSKPHRCSLCAKRFTAKSNLTRHIKLVHNGVKSHKCQYCKKKFGSKSNLNVHLMIHKGIKPYACSVCDKRFVRNFLLTAHQAMHNNKKLHSCSVCHKGFNTNASLKQHQLTHSNNSFKCNLCNSTFRVKGYLKRHLSKTHR